MLGGSEAALRTLGFGISGSLQWPPIFISVPVPPATFWSPTPSLRYWVPPAVLSARIRARSRLSGDAILHSAVAKSTLGSPRYSGISLPSGYSVFFLFFINKNIYLEVGKVPTNTGRCLRRRARRTGAKPHMEGSSPLYTLVDMSSRPRGQPCARSASRGIVSEGPLLLGGVARVPILAALSGEAADHDNAALVDLRQRRVCYLSPDCAYHALPAQLLARHKA